MINVVVLEGVLARPAQDRELPSGSRLLTLEVTVSRPDGPAEPVPVAWFDAPAWAASLDEGSSLSWSGGSGVGFSGPAAPPRVAPR